MGGGGVDIDTGVGEVAPDSLPLTDAPNIHLFIFQWFLKVTR